MEQHDRAVGTGAPATLDIVDHVASDSLGVVAQAAPPVVGDRVAVDVPPSLGGDGLQHERVGVPVEIGQAEQRPDRPDAAVGERGLGRDELGNDLAAGEVGERSMRVAMQPDDHALGFEARDLVVGGTALDPASLHEQGGRCACIDQRVDHCPEVAVLAGVVTRLDVDRESEPHRPRAYFRGRMPAWKMRNAVAHWRA